MVCEGARVRVMHYEHLFIVGHLNLNYWKLKSRNPEFSGFGKPQRFKVAEPPDICGFRNPESFGFRDLGFQQLRLKFPTVAKGKKPSKP